MTAPAMTFAIQKEYVEGYLAADLAEADELQKQALTEGQECAEPLIEAGLIYSRLASRAATHARYEDDELRRAALEELSRWMQSHTSTCEGLAFDLQNLEPRDRRALDITMVPANRDKTVRQDLRNFSYRNHHLVGLRLLEHCGVRIEGSGV